MDDVRFARSVTFIITVVSGDIVNMAILSTMMRSLAISVFVAGSYAANITDDAYFYGQSPPVYPSRRSISPL